MITILHDNNIYWVLEDVARRPPSYYSLQCCYQFIISKAIHSPLLRGGGKPRKRRGGGASAWGGAFVYLYTIAPIFRKASNHNLKAWVLGCKSMGFRV